MRWTPSSIAIRGGNLTEETSWCARSSGCDCAARLRWKKHCHLERSLRAGDLHRNQSAPSSRRSRKTFSGGLASPAWLPIRDFESAPKGVAEGMLVATLHGKMDVSVAKPKLEANPIPVRLGSARAKRVLLPDLGGALRLSFKVYNRVWRIGCQTTIRGLSTTSCSARVNAPIPRSPRKTPLKMTVIFRPQARLRRQLQPYDARCAACRRSALNLIRFQC